MSKHLTIGFGEVGKAINAIVGGEVHDPHSKKEYDGICEVMHVCFPYSPEFNTAVEAYKRRFKPVLTIIHSTVPVGTSRALECVHSPIRGVHPHLEEGIRTMVKYFGGKDAEMAAEYFRKLGVSVKVVDKSETTEALKLWSTTQYGVFIDLNKEIHKWCEENNVDFDIVYTHANETYNEGYLKLGRPEVMRPVLKYMGGTIGGHCVLPNCKILDSESTKKLNDKYAIQ